MVSNMTVLALVALLCCAMADQKGTNDEFRLQMQDQRVNLGMDGNIPYNDYQKELEKINGEVIGAIAFFYVILVCIIAGINIFLCIKCLRKRAVSNGIKQQIQMKRMEFATMNGLDLRTLNDPRYSQTVHA